MRSLIVFLVISTALLVNGADDKQGEVHTTTVRVKPGIISKLLGSKPTSISLEDNKSQKRPALLSYYPVLADYPDQFPEQLPQQQQQQNPNINPYTFLPQKPFYQPPRPYPQPYPVPVPVAYPQPQPLPVPIPSTYPVGFPPVYPGGLPSFPQYPAYPNYPPPIYPPQFPSKYPLLYPNFPGYPGYPFLAEPGDESGSSTSGSQNQNQDGETVTNPDLAGESGDDNNLDYIRQKKPTSGSETVAAMQPMSTPSSQPLALPSSVPIPYVSMPMLSPLNVSQ